MPPTPEPAVPCSARGSKDQWAPRPGAGGLPAGNSLYPQASGGKEGVKACGTDPSLCLQSGVGQGSVLPSRKLMHGPEK